MTISEAEEVAHPEGSEYGRNKVTIPRKQVPITTKLTTGRLAQLGKRLPTTPVIGVQIQMKLPLLRTINRPILIFQKTYSTRKNWIRKKRTLNSLGRVKGNVA